MFDAARRVRISVIGTRALRRRSPARAAGLVLLAVAGLVPAACGGGSHHTPPRASNSAEGTWSTQAITEVSAADGVQLKKVKFEKMFEGGDYSYITLCRDTDVPEVVQPNGSASFCYGSYHPGFAVNNNDTGFYMYYDVMVPNPAGGWKTSGYYADMATKVVRVGERRIECTIKQAGSTDIASGAPFKCIGSWTGDGPDSHPHFKVTANPVTVIDATDTSKVQEAASLITANCERIDTLHCSWTRTAKSTAFAPSKDPVDQAQWIPLTSEADSCPPAHESFEIRWERKNSVGWSDEFGVKAGGEASFKVEFLAELKASIEFQYRHSVEQSVEETEGYVYKIPLGYRSALYMLHGFLKVTGDFQINTRGGDRYLVKNAIFQFPLTQNVTIEGRGQPVQRAVVIHDDKPCENAHPPHGTRLTQKIGVLKPIA